MTNFYPNKWQNLQSIGALFILIGILLPTLVNTKKLLVSNISSPFVLITISLGLFIIGINKFVFYKNGWGEKFTILDYGNAGLEKPSATKLEKAILLIESMICFIVSIGLFLFGIYTVFFVSK